MADENQNNFNLQEQRFNQEPFIFNITIEYIDLSNPNNSVTQTFTKADILNLTLIKDINNIVCSGSLMLRDISNVFALNINKTGNWFITLDIIQKRTASDIKNSTLSKSFIIQTINPTSLQTNAAIFEIRFIDPVIQVLLKNVAFTTYNGNIEGSDRCEILSKLLTMAGFKYGTDYDKFEPCGIIDHYITDIDTPLINHIDNLLSQIYSKDKGLLFLYRGMFDNKFNHYWTKDVLKEKNDGSLEAGGYLLTIASSDSQIKTETTVAAIKSYGTNSPYDVACKVLIPTYIQRFDYEKALVEVKEGDSFNDTFFTDFFKNGDDTTALIPKNIYNNDNLIEANKNYIPGINVKAPGNYYNEGNNWEFTSNLRTFFLNSELTCFKVIGKIWREPGHNFVIAYNKKGTDTKYSGAWFCTRIVDVFEKDEYYQYIFCVRTSNSFEISNISNAVQEIKKGN